MNSTLHNLRGMDYLKKGNDGFIPDEAHPISMQLKQKTGWVSLFVRVRHKLIAHFHLADGCLSVTDWSVFWLLAKDVLRLSKYYPAFRTFNTSGIQGLQENELPIETLVKTSLFQGELNIG